MKLSFASAADVMTVTATEVVIDKAMLAGLRNVRCGYFTVCIEGVDVNTEETPGIHSGSGAGRDMISVLLTMAVFSR